MTIQSRDEKTSKKLDEIVWILWNFRFEFWNSVFVAKSHWFKTENEKKEKPFTKRVCQRQKRIDTTDSKSSLYGIYILRVAFKMSGEWQFGTVTIAELNFIVYRFTPNRMAWRKNWNTNIRQTVWTFFPQSNHTIAHEICCFFFIPFLSVQFCILLLVFVVKFQLFFFLLHPDLMFVCQSVLCVSCLPSIYFSYGYEHWFFTWYLWKAKKKVNLKIIQIDNKNLLITCFWWKSRGAAQKLWLCHADWCKIVAQSTHHVTPLDIVQFWFH